MGLTCGFYADLRRVSKVISIFREIHLVARNFILTMLVLILGIGVGWSVALGRRHMAPNQWNLSNGEIDDLVRTKELYQDLRTKFSALNDIDLEEYVQLKSEKEKFDKANEILGKILVIFMADLGLKVTGSRAALARQASATMDGLANPGAGTIAPVPTSINNGSEQSQGSPVRAETSNANKWTQNEAKLDTLRGDTEVDAFLESTRIQDFASERDASVPLIKKPGLAEPLNGAFEGDVNLEEGKVWTMHMEVNGQVMRNGKFQGQAQITLSEGGKVFSRKNDNGDLDGDFRNFAGSDHALLLELSPDLYAQVYYLKAQDEFIGNIYRLEKHSGTKYKCIGKFALRRL